jgi:hypothetical protein
VSTGAVLSQIHHRRQQAQLCRQRAREGIAVQNPAVLSHAITRVSIAKRQNRVKRRKHVQRAPCSHKFTIAVSRPSCVGSAPVRELLFRTLRCYPTPSQGSALQNDKIVSRGGSTCNGCRALTVPSSPSAVPARSELCSAKNFLHRSCDAITTHAITRVSVPIGN